MAMALASAARTTARAASRPPAPTSKTAASKASPQSAHENTRRIDPSWM